MNKEAITVGDVYKSKCGTAIVTYAKCTIINTVICLMYTDGSTTDVGYEFFLKNYHKVGHIEKFAEALKELQEMAKSRGN